MDWPFFGEICRALALRVAREYQPEIVLGIAKAGVIPGAVVASILQCEFTSMIVTRRNEGGEPVLVAGPPASIRGRRVLVVDETCDTGTPCGSRSARSARSGPAEVRSAVSFKTGEYAPDYHAFETENFIILPWDREIIQNGELVVRPDTPPAWADHTSVLERLLDAIKNCRADYADIRLERSFITSVAWRGRRLEGASTGTDVGGTVRCLNHGHGGGVASFNRLDDLEARLARAHGSPWRCGLPSRWCWRRHRCGRGTWARLSRTIRATSRCWRNGVTWST